MDIEDLQLKYELNDSLVNYNCTKDRVYCSVSVNQFDKICRTCLSDNSDFRSIYDVIYDNVSVIYLLENYASIQILSMDYLPQNICSACIAELFRFYEFREKCKTNEKLLKTVVENEEVDKQKEKIQTEPELSSNTEYAEDTTAQEQEDSFAESNSSDSECEEEEQEEKKPRRVSERTRSRSTSKRRKVQKGSLKCRDCSEVCESRDKLRQHRKDAKHPENRTHACSECGKMFTSSKLRQHMRAHTKEKPYVCEVCSQGFSMSGNLKRHMMTHTGERPHVCEICGKGFIQSTTLVNHRRTHTNAEKSNEDSTPNFTCNHCGRGFKRLARYNAHQSRHYSEGTGVVPRKADADDEVREYICDICKRAYKTKHLLKAHQLTHGEKTFLCSDCGKGFVTKAALQSHLKVHTGEKPHTCNVCQKSFAHVGSFEAHMLIHTGQKPYNCKVCTKAFTQLSHLKYHLRTHSGERPYICSYCGKSFALKGNLTVHVRIHTGETPYTCPVCGKGFYDSSSMKKHRRAHGEKHTNPQLSTEQIELLDLQPTETRTISYLPGHELLSLNQNLHTMQVQIVNQEDILCKY